MEWIDNILMGISDIYDTYNIHELYDYLKIKIVSLDSNNILLHGNEAFYNRDYIENETVFIRNDLNICYERFILAHELAHALLHTEVYSAAFNKDLINKGKFEKQANYFALKLLKINLVSEQYKDLTLKQIASCLELPEEVLNQLVNV
ncbi:MAG: phage repressor protein [Clostridiaceae bacterium]|jgi:Zn-dependent peptidase ImmA (M78 family)|nr:phage repressor protein [Clostridiaceae bacterium]